MKMRKIACLAITVLIVAAVCAFPASAASLQLSQVYTGNTAFTELTNANASTVGAVAAHNVFLDQYTAGSYGYISTKNAWGYNEGATGDGMTLADMLPASEYDYAYVAYKVSADTGNCIDSLDLSIKGYLNKGKPSADNSNKGDQNYQLAVFIMNSLTADGTGKVDFSGKTPALLIGSTAAAVDFRTNPQTLSAYDCDGILGESKDVYIVVVPFISWSSTGGTVSGTDSARCRFAAIELTATQKATTQTEKPEDTENPGTSDTVILPAITLLLLSGVAVVICGKKRSK